MSGPLADAWERVESACRKRPLVYKVCIGTPLPPVLPYRARVDYMELTPGHKRRHQVRFVAEGLTLAEALNALADEMSARP